MSRAPDLFPETDLEPDDGCECDEDPCVCDVEEEAPA